MTEPASAVLRAPDSISIVAIIPMGIRWPDAPGKQRESPMDRSRLMQAGMAARTGS